MFRLYIRRKFFNVKVVNNWDRLSREIVDTQPWKCSRPGWVGACEKLGLWKVSLSRAGVLELNDLYSSFQPKPFYNSMII